MNLYLLSQGDNRGYDTYDSCVVCAKSEDEARLMRPNWEPTNTSWENGNWHDWAEKPENVRVTLIGRAVRTLPKSVICYSFNAG